jgi:hypothetical protein
VTDDEVVKVMDFGQAKRTSHESSGIAVSGFLAGNPGA